MRGKAVKTMRRCLTPRCASFSSGGIYDWNRFSGGDRAADANVAAYGAHFRRRDEADGRELWTLEFAQRYYFRRPRIVLPGESSPPERGFANLFAELKARPDKRWKLEGQCGMESGGQVV